MPVKNDDPNVYLVTNDAQFPLLGICPFSIPKVGQVVKVSDHEQDPATNFNARRVPYGGVNLRVLAIDLEAGTIEVEREEVPLVMKVFVPDHSQKGFVQLLFEKALNSKRGSLDLFAKLLKTMIERQPQDEAAIKQRAEDAMREHDQGYTSGRK